MSSNNFAISVTNLNKCYEIYQTPRDRLKQFVLPTLQRIVGKSREQYFREFWALQDVSFDIKKGETVGIIGRNGSGKSTLLQMICGTLTPTSGSVQANGRIAALLELGSGFNPEFTGRENVYLNAAVLGLTKEEVDMRFDDIATFADIGSFIEQPVKTYSSGMVVRLAFAVQAHVTPDVLIVDEALAVGDVFFQQKCARFMRDNLTDCTKLLVTHDMQAIYNFCSRVIVLEGGKIVFMGNVREGIEAYLRSNHSDIFKDTNLKKVDLKNLELLDIIENQTQSTKRPIALDAMGGRKGIQFQNFSVAINDKSHNAESASVFAGDKIEISMDLFSSESLEEIILGYLLVDRNGMYVCGDNTLSLDLSFSISSQKRAAGSLIFRWPAVANGTYTLTLGIGRGKDPLNHVIECWAHSIYAFESISHSPVHGLFTNHVIEAKLKEIN